MNLAHRLRLVQRAGGAVQDTAGARSAGKVVESPYHNGLLKQNRMTSRNRIHPKRSNMEKSEGEFA